MRAASQPALNAALNKLARELPEQPLEALAKSAWCTRVGTSPRDLKTERRVTVRVLLCVSRGGAAGLVMWCDRIIIVHRTTHIVFYLPSVRTVPTRNTVR